MSDITFAHLSRQHACSYPNKIAVVDGDVRLTWPEFEARVDRVVTVLTDSGVGRGDRILWLAQSSFRFLELFVASARVGAMICPANWRQSAAELAFVIEDFDPALIVWQDEEIGERVHEARKQAGGKARWVQHDSADAEAYDALVDSATPTTSEFEVSAHDPLLVIYTAAIVDRPSGSMLSHRNLLAMATVTAPITQADHNSVFVNSGPLFHIGNFQFDSLPVFLMGGTNVYVRRVEAKDLLELIARERVTSAFLMPPTIMEILELNKVAQLDISSLHAGPFAPIWGDALPADPALWGSQPGGFGQTEVTGLCVLNALGGKGLGNSGRPSPLAEVQIVDPSGNRVPNGTSGEIVVRGETVHCGYWNRPAVNAARLQDGWWRTTDMGRIESDGTLHFLGTMTRMIKSAAENIYPPEVEACLTSHAAVREAAIIGVPDPRFVQSVKAVVVLEPGHTATEAEIIDHCRAHIASYKKPKSVAFVEAIPKVAGKTDYDALDAAFGGGGYPGGANV